MGPGETRRETPAVSPTQPISAEAEPNSAQLQGFPGRGQVQMLPYLWSVQRHRLIPRQEGIKGAEARRGQKEMKGPGGREGAYLGMHECERERGGGER